MSFKPLLEGHVIQVDGEDVIEVKTPYDQRVFHLQKTDKFRYEGSFEALLKLLGRKKQ